MIASAGVGGSSVSDFNQGEKQGNARPLGKECVPHFVPTKRQEPSQSVTKRAGSIRGGFEHNLFACFR